MKVVTIIKAHKDKNDNWITDDGFRFNAAAGIIIDVHADNEDDVIIAFSPEEFDKYDSELEFSKVINIANKKLYSYSHLLKVKSSQYNVNILFGEELVEYFPTKLPEKIYFRIFKV